MPVETHEQTFAGGRRWGGGGLAGVVIGAATGSALGLIVGVAGGYFKPLQPDSGYADAITKCLKEKGYEVSGWE